MKDSSAASPTHVPWLGITCCLLSAVFYTGANARLRGLAEMEAGPAWVTCLKETVAVIVLGPWLLWGVLDGNRIPIHRRALLLILQSALFGQLIGNLGLQWAFGVVGLVVALPMVFGALLLGSAAIGAIVLREPMDSRSSIAVAVVVVSIVLLSAGAAGEYSASSSAGSSGMRPIATRLVSIFTVGDWTPGIPNGYNRGSRALLPALRPPCIPTCAIRKGY